MSKVDEVIEYYESQIESLAEEIKECERTLSFLNNDFNWLYDRFGFKKKVSLFAKERGPFSREREVELSDRILANMMYGTERQKKMAEEQLNDCKKWRDEELARIILENKESIE